MTSEILPVLVTGITVGGAVLAFFWKTEDVTSPQARQTISDWLKGTQALGALDNLPAQFIALFDRVFGERHLSWRCFLRSCVASLAAVAVMTAVWATLRPEAWDKMFSYTAYPNPLVTWLVMVLAFNLIPDYVSLLQTRFFLRWMTRSRATIMLIAWLFLDVIATLTIFAVATWLVWIGVFSIGLELWESGTVPTLYFKHTIWLELNILVQSAQLGSIVPTVPSFGVLFYSTFFTSVWLWLYSASAITVRFLRQMNPAIEFLKWFLDIENHPIRSLGVLAGGVVCFSYWLFAWWLLR